MHVAIGCDHAGYPYKSAIIALLRTRGDDVVDFGTDSTDSVDYPDFVHPVAKAVTGKKAKFGVLICGSGNGVCMTANKHKGIRAAICWKKDIALLSRRHNDANILCIPARFLDQDLALEVVEAFLSSVFEGGRHTKRVEKISLC